MLLQLITRQSLPLSGNNHDRFASDVAAGLDGRDLPRRSRRSRSRSRSYSDDDDRPRRHRESPGRGDRPAGGRSRQAPPSCTVYIRNLPLDLNETDLFKLLEAFPNVAAVRIGRDRSTGRNKGFAFVDFASGELTDHALIKCKHAPL